MRIESQISFMIKDMFERDQGEEEVIHQVTRLFHRYHDEIYKEVLTEHRENQRLKAKLDIAVHMLFLTACDNQLHDIKELGIMAKQTLDRLGVER